jgi:hypothetical protein
MLNIYQINALKVINIYNPVYRSLLKIENWRDIYNSKPNEEIKREIAALKTKIETLVAPTFKEESHSVYNMDTSDSQTFEGSYGDNSKANIGIKEQIAEFILILSKMDEELLHFPMYFIGLLLLYVIVYFIRVNCNGKRSKTVKKTKI